MNSLNYKAWTLTKGFVTLTTFALCFSQLSHFQWCLSSSLLLPCLPSRLSPPSVPVKLLSLQPPWWASISLHFCLSSSISACPFCQLSGTPKWLWFLSARFFSQLLQSLGVPFLSQEDIVALGPTLVLPSRAIYVNCVSTVALFGIPDLQPLSLVGGGTGRDGEITSLDSTDMDLRKLWEIQSSQSVGMNNHTSLSCSPLTLWRSCFSLNFSLFPTRSLEGSFSSMKLSLPSSSQSSSLPSLVPHAFLNFPFL